MAIAEACWIDNEIKTGVVVWYNVASQEGYLGPDIESPTHHLNYYFTSQFEDFIDPNNLVPGTCVAYQTIAWRDCRTQIKNLKIVDCK